MENILLSIILVKVIGIGGLALASSIGGFYLLWRNLVEFGFNNFLAIIRPKKLAIIAALCVVEILIIIIFKGLIDGYI